MTGGDLVELEADELGRFCAFLGGKNKKCSNIWTGLWLWFILKLIECRVYIVGVAGRGAVGWARNSARLAVLAFGGRRRRADVEPQYRPGGWLPS